MALSQFRINQVLLREEGDRAGMTMTAGNWDDDAVATFLLTDDDDAIATLLLTRMATAESWMCVKRDEYGKIYREK